MNRKKPISHAKVKKGGCQHAGLSHRQHRRTDYIGAPCVLTHGNGRLRQGMVRDQAPKFIAERRAILSCTYRSMLRHNSNVNACSVADALLFILLQLYIKPTVFRATVCTFPAAWCPEETPQREYSYIPVRWSTRTQQHCRLVKRHLGKHARKPELLAIEGNVHRALSQQ